MSSAPFLLKQTAVPSEHNLYFDSLIPTRFTCVSVNSTDLQVYPPAFQWHFLYSPSTLIFSLSPPPSQIYNIEYFHAIPPSNQPGREEGAEDTPIGRLG